MAKELATDELRDVVELLPPEEPPKPDGGRPRIDDRGALTGILFVLKKSAIPREMLPQEMGCAVPARPFTNAAEGPARWLVGRWWRRIFRG